MDVSNTSDQIQIKIKVPNPSQKPPASSKAPTQDLKDMDVLCVKIKIESWNLDHRCIKDLKDMDVPCTFKIKIVSLTSAYGWTKDQWLYPNQAPDAKCQSGISSVLQSQKSGLKGHGCSLHLLIQDGEPKFGAWVHQRQVIISKSRSKFQTPVRNLQHPPKPQMRT